MLRLVYGTRLHGSSGGSDKGVYMNTQLALFEWFMIHADQGSSSVVKQVTGSLETPGSHSLMCQW
jgi:hypothetical protein